MQRDSSHDLDALPGELVAALAEAGIEARGEVALRMALEERIPGYSLYRLTPAAAKRWKCRYRLMADAGYVDGQSVAEVYARALLGAWSGN